MKYKKNIRSNNKKKNGKYKHKIGRDRDRDKEHARRRRTRSKRSNERAPAKNELNERVRGSLYKFYFSNQNKAYSKFTAKRANNNNNNNKQRKHLNNKDTLAQSHTHHALSLNPTSNETKRDSEKSFSTLIELNYYCYYYFFLCSKSIATIHIY